MSKPQLGQRVTYSKHLRRRSAHPDGIGPGRIWSTEYYPGKDNPGGEGIVVGVRTLSNGDAHWDDWGSGYRPKEHFDAYLIAYNVHRKPVFVLPEHVTLLEGNPDDRA